MLIIKSILLIALAIIAVPRLTLCQTVRSQTAVQEAAAQEVLKTEREQREAYLQRDIEKTERLVADEFILTNGRSTPTWAHVFSVCQGSREDLAL